MVINQGKNQPIAIVLAVTMMEERMDVDKDQRKTSPSILDLGSSCNLIHKLGGIIDGGIFDRLPVIFTK